MIHCLVSEGHRAVSVPVRHVFDEVQDIGLAQPGGIPKSCV